MGALRIAPKCELIAGRLRRHWYGLRCEGLHHAGCPIVTMGDAAKTYVRRRGAIRQRIRERVTPDASWINGQVVRAKQGVV
jgi:hypothetical protein